MTIQNIFKKSSLVSMFLVATMSLAIVGCDNTPDIKVSDTELFSQDWWKTATVSDVKSLVKQKIDFNRKDPRNNNFSIFSIAAGHTESPEIISQMLKNGANVNIQDDLGGTPLLAASLSSKSPEIIKILLKNGANINIKTKEGNNALHMAVMYNCHSIDVIKTLVKYGLDVNSKDNMGATPLIKAASTCKTPDILKILIDNGANINDKNDMGIDALIAASVQNDNPEIIHFLVKNGAKISPISDNKSDFKSVLAFASMNNNPKVFEVVQKYYFNNLDEEQKITVCIGHTAGLVERADSKKDADAFIISATKDFESTYGHKINTQLMLSSKPIGYKSIEEIVHFLSDKCYPLLYNWDKTMEKIQ